MADRPKRKPRDLTVSSSAQLTRNMRRVTLQGADLATFPDDAAGTYIKLTFASGDPDRPIMRTYTVANHRPADREIDIDFMLHTSADGAEHGFAAPWAINAQAGDAISIFGPGNATFINTEADWYLLAADMTALPAMTANLAFLPADAKGYVVVEILSEEDKQELPVPAAMQVIWVINPQAGSDESPLFHAIAKLDWLDSQVSIWAACEFKTMKKIRQYFKSDKAVDKSHLYVSSYWKQGLNEEQHKVVKREDNA